MSLSVCGGDRLGKGTRELPGVIELFQIGAVPLCANATAQTPQDVHIKQGHFICTLHLNKKINQQLACTASSTRPCAKGCTGNTRFDRPNSPVGSACLYNTCSSNA